ncbi:MAG: tetratricopeptide repeat protein [Acidobacteria bacterium]|nr:tetratricopeptide repeat protein [Acidobacteriota bacterium]
MRHYPNSIPTASKDRGKLIGLIVGAVSLFTALGSVPVMKSKNPDHFTQANAALRSGDYAVAAKSFESALKDKTNLEESRAGLLQTLRQTGAYREAVERSEDFLASQNRSPLLHLERGRIAEAMGDYPGAEKHLRQARSLASAGSTAYLDATRVLADLLEETGRRDEARILWDGLIEEFRNKRISGSQNLGNFAAAAWRRGYIEDAKDIFLDATDPDRGEVSLEMLAGFGYLFLEKYNAQEALGVFRDCLDINRFYPEALIGIALAKRYDNDFEAETYAGSALKVNPNFGPALNILAELAIESEDHEEALKYIRAALDTNPANLEALSMQAVCRYFRGDAAGFAETEKKVLAINPSYGHFYYTMAEAFVSHRRYQEAVDFNRKAVALDPELWAAHASLGMNLTRIGNLQEGRRAIQTAFEGDPYNVWAFNSLKLLDQMDTFVRSRSAHFNFLMSKEDAPVLSSYVSELAEEAYSKLTQRYGFKPAGPIQVEIFPDHGGFAVRILGLPGLGGALGVCFGRVVAMDSPRERKAGDFNWGSTLWHELVHVMTLQMSNHNIPRWYTEGLSVYEENRARPGWGDKLTVSFMKAHKEGRLLKASELNAGITRPKTAEQIMLSYYQAGLVCKWIEEKFGFDKIRKSLLLFAENRPAEEVFRETLGMDTARMDAAFADFLNSQVRQLAAHFNFDQPAANREEEPGGGNTRAGLEKQLQNNPGDFFANLNMGRLLFSEGARAEAEVYLKKAQQLFPHYVEPGNPYQLLGQMYLDMNRHEDSLAEYLAWSRLDGNSTEPLIKAAEIYGARSEWAPVARNLALSIYIHPYNPDVLKKLGDAAMKSSKWNEAISAFRALSGLNTSDAAGSHFDLARALLASGNKREAKRETLRALEIAPTFMEAQKLLLKLTESAAE